MLVTIEDFIQYQQRMQRITNQMTTIECPTCRQSSMIAINNAHNMTCQICLENDDPCIVLLCGHGSCKKCFDKYCNENILNQRTDVDLKTTYGEYLHAELINQHNQMMHKLRSRDEEIKNLKKQNIDREMLINKYKKEIKERDEWIMQSKKEIKERDEWIKEITQDNNSLMKTFNYGICEWCNKELTDIKPGRFHTYKCDDKYCLGLGHLECNGERV